MLKCFSRFVGARLYAPRMPATAVQIVNNHALPFFEEHAVKIQTILSDTDASTAAGRTSIPTSSSRSSMRSRTAPLRSARPTAILRPTTPVGPHPRPRDGGTDALRGLQGADPAEAVHPEALSRKGGQDRSVALTSARPGVR